MWNVEDFIKEYYDVEVGHNLTLDEFERWKEENEIEEWDYPLEEYEHLVENNLKCAPVRFSESYGDYDYRWCEIPERN